MWNSSADCKQIDADVTTVPKIGIFVEIHVTIGGGGAGGGGGGGCIMQLRACGLMMVDDTPSIAAGR